MVRADICFYESIAGIHILSIPPKGSLQVVFTATPSDLSALGFETGPVNIRSHPHLSPPRPSGNSSFPPGFLLIGSWVLSVSFPCSFPQEERKKKTITSQEGLVSGPTKGLEKVWGRGASRARCRLGNKVMALVLFKMIGAQFLFLYEPCWGHKKYLVFANTWKKWQRKSVTGGRVGS